MKTKVFLLAFAALMMTGCAKTGKDKVTDAFKEYVETDFNDPNDFIEITEFMETDTFNNKVYRNSIELIRAFDGLLTEKQRRRLDVVSRMLDKDSIFIVEHPIKVRMWGTSGKKTVREFVVIENNGAYHVQDHRLHYDEVPYVGREVYDIMGEVIVATGGME